MNDTEIKIDEVDVIDERKITKADVEFLAGHLSEVPQIDTLLKRMLSDSMNGYFLATTEEKRISHKAEHNFIKRIRVFVIREKEKKRIKRKTQ